MYEKFERWINNAMSESEVMETLQSAQFCNELSSKQLDLLYFLGNDKVQNLVGG